MLPIWRRTYVPPLSLQRYVHAGMSLLNELVSASYTLDCDRVATMDHPLSSHLMPAIVFVLNCSDVGASSFVQIEYAS